MTHTITKFPGLRILAVENLMFHRDNLEGMLINIGCEYEIVDNETDAIELHESNPFDVIILDTFMFNSDEYQMIQEIQKMPGKAGLVHIIALTAELITGEVGRLFSHKITRRIKKPLRIQELEKTLLNLKRPQTTSRKKI